MSYTPTNWSTGDTITASALNKIENGIADAGGIFWITATETEQGDGTFVVALNKTFLEIYTAVQSKLLCVIAYNRQVDPPTTYEAKQEIVKETYYDSSEGATVFAENTFTCSSLNDYPAYID